MISFMIIDIFMQNRCWQSNSENWKKFFMKRYKNPNKKFWADEEHVSYTHEVFRIRVKAIGKKKSLGPEIVIKWNNAFEEKTVFTGKVSLGSILKSVW